MSAETKVTAAKLVNGRPLAFVGVVAGVEEVGKLEVDAHQVAVARVTYEPLLIRSEPFNQEPVVRPPFAGLRRGEAVLEPRDELSGCAPMLLTL